MRFLFTGCSKLIGTVGYIGEGDRDGRDVDVINASKVWFKFKILFLNLKGKSIPKINVKPLRSFISALNSTGSKFDPWRRQSNIRLNIIFIFVKKGLKPQ